MRRVAGVDEAGRGPLAGPVVAAAVILHPDHVPEGLDDSKKLSPARRAKLFDEIRRLALGWSIARASVVEVDRLNILQASLLAMQRAVDGLDPAPEFVRVDGNRCPLWPYASEAVVGGDALVAEISAASILAKESRDREMRELDRRHPGYGFAENKGYPTAAHLECLQRLGPSSEHRRSFAPVRRLLQAVQFEIPDP